MTLEFLSPSRCAEGTLSSPLRRALQPFSGNGGPQPVLVDRSLEGKLELRGDLDLVEPLDDEELVRLSPRRGFLLTPHDPADAVERYREQGVLAYDATALWAGFALEGERFRVYVAQELGHDVAIAVLDAARGLEANP